MAKEARALSLCTVACSACPAAGSKWNAFVEPSAHAASTRLSTYLPYKASQPNGQRGDGSAHAASARLRTYSHVLDGCGV